jgi:TPP-dependent pyruvate/acetoin dehydrogenase alpha subunit
MTKEQEQKLDDLETIVKRNNVELWAITVSLTALKQHLLEKKLVDEKTLATIEEDLSKQIVAEVEKHANDLREGKGADPKNDILGGGPSN